jgi:hypothetical protein
MSDPTEPIDQPREPTVIVRRASSTAVGNAVAILLVVAIGAAIVAGAGRSLIPSLRGAGAPTPTPEITALPSGSFTPRPIPSFTVTPRPTPTPSRSPTPTRTATATPRVTPTAPTPLITLPPTPPPKTLAPTTPPTTKP